MEFKWILTSDEKLYNHSLYNHHKIKKILVKILKNSFITTEIKDEQIMDDFAVLVGILATSGIAINIYLIKSIANLCERLAVLETKLHTAQAQPIKLRLDILD